ncbi:Transposable element Tc1 transposase, partial [Stegodyphus mimosarum]
MTQRAHLDDFLLGRIIGRLECGRTQLKVPDELGTAQSVISRLWQRFQDDGNVSRRYSTGRPRVTTPNEDRYLAVTANSNRWSTASDLFRQLSSATGTTISRQTVYRRLGQIGLYARRPVRCIPLTTTHCRLRLAWSREHALWTQQQWACVMFSIESRIIGRLECGRTQLKVPDELGTAQSVISRLWQRFQDDGNVSRRYSTGRPRVTTPNEDRYLAVTANSNRWSTASDLFRQLSSATGTTISRQTVYRRLGQIGLYARRPVRCIPLTTTHCRLRLAWSREHALWTQQQWACVMFSIESRFSLQSDSRRTFIWRAPDTRYHQENITE